MGHESRITNHESRITNHESRIAAIIIVIAVSVLGLFVNRLPAQDAGTDKVELVTKTITGEISGISSNFIALLCGVDSQSGAAKEMAFNLDKNLQIEHKNSLKDLMLEDMVDIVYDEITVTDKEGKVSIKRQVRLISFLKRPEKPLEDVTLDSADEEEIRF